MKYLITLLAMLVSVYIYAQDTISMNIERFETNIKTIGGNSIIFSLYPDFTKSNCAEYEMDNELFDANAAQLKPQLIFKEKDNDIILSDFNMYATASPKAIHFSISNPSEDLINKLLQDLLDPYIKVEHSIVFEIWKNRDPSTLIPVKIEIMQIETYTSNKPNLTEAMAEELINSKKGDIGLIDNKIDFGIIPAEQSASQRTEFNVSFNYKKRYRFLKNDLPIFFYSEALIGTNSLDSLNYISIYPLSYNFINGTNEFIGQVGIDANQVFSNYRISANFFWNGIVPNAIDLTFGENRLRLNPVFKLGVKFYQEIENNRAEEIDNNKFSNQIFADLYYYIPIQKSYSLILEGTAFYDFNPSVNPHKKVMFNYSATLGVDIPNTNFRTIFKYVKGQNGISYQSNDYYMFGFMISTFNIKI
jgi:hypothetical protein